VSALVSVAAACLIGAGCGANDDTPKAVPDQSGASEATDTDRSGTQPSPPSSSKEEKKTKEKDEAKDEESEPESTAESTSPDSGPKTRSGGRRGRSAALPPKRVTVTIRDFEFGPKRVTIRRGGSVYWVNKSKGMEHTATFKSGPPPKSGNYSPPASPYIGRMGGTYEDFFKTRGTTVYYCTIHPSMRGFITVK
jgi:plastocyanin